MANFKALVPVYELIEFDFEDISKYVLIDSKYNKNIQSYNVTFRPVDLENNNNVKNILKAYPNLQVDEEKMFFELDGRREFGRFNAGESIAFYPNGDWRKYIRFSVNNVRSEDF